MSERTTRDGKAVGVTAAAVSMTAAACAVCCVLPFALPAAALASFGGIIAWLAGAYPWVTVIGVLAVVAAWLWVVLGSYKSRAKPAGTTIAVMLVATTMLGLALLWPRLEPTVIAFLLG
ncbi:hypothetical protein [Paracoccus binzhouensis]|uniref:hypothetical protein n=1 Tax=Paracoccus binzhouensis TaxID=2796149 RepID=UPI0018EF102B|nr:hypothetical protein [Paracoccus binzhouensis]